MPEDHKPKSDRRRLDRLDRRILALLQLNNRASLARIAQSVNSSRSVVQRRISHLRRSRTIQSDVSIIKRNAVAGLSAFIINLHVRRERSDLLEAFVQSVEGLPEVQQCYFTTGRANCMAIVLLRDVAHLDEFIETNFVDNPFIRRVHARLVTREIKVGLAIPIGPHQPSL